VTPLLQTYRNPDKSKWAALCARPDFQSVEISRSVQEIITSVHTTGDRALLELTTKHDGVTLEKLRVSDADLNNATLPEDLLAAIDRAARNIKNFHTSQTRQEEVVETMPGVRCWRKSVPLESVGLYIPGGTAPLFSTVLMLGIPAQLAGCKKIILCTPPMTDGHVHPAILYAAKLVGVTEVFKIGGAQAIAAMAYGTASVPAVDKIFGPGNRYVTEAKLQVQRDTVAIDMPAGPSEVLVYTDHTSRPDFAAADLLAQAEHGIDSQVMLVSIDEEKLAQTATEVKEQLTDLPRREIATKSLENSKAIFFTDKEEAIAFMNFYAAEHLILLADDCESISSKIFNAGSIFLGHYSPESVGDYASGTNHTLPTGGWAKSYSGVSLDSFVKKITYQQLSQDGLAAIAPVVEIMAENEQLIGHQRAVTIRRQKS